MHNINITRMSEVKEVPINSMVKSTSHLFISTLKLFNGIPVRTQKKRNPTQKICEETINHGFIFSPQVVGNNTDKELRAMINIIADEIGLTPEQMNSTFHKSWKKVRDAPYFQLLVEQAFHYMTTYGYERMGVYDKNQVFIPNERFDIPELEGGLKLVVIQGYTISQLKEKILKMLNSGMALKSIDEAVEVAKYCKLSDDEVLRLNNKEVRVRLYHELDLVPEDPTDFLRLVLFETTEKTLLINNLGTTKLIKESKTDNAGIFLQYDEDFGYKRLAEIFQRFKPLFIAFKASETMIPIINKISHLSNKYHRTMKQSLLNNITAMIKKGIPIYPSKLNTELDKVNIFRKIRLAQSLKYRMTGNKSIMYKIRNGKAFATEMEFTNINDAEKVYDIIIKSITKDLKHLKGKEFYIPEHLTYSLPATEKQFTGNIPSGSYITVGKDMIFGVHWDNVEAPNRRNSEHDQYLTSYDYGDDTHNGKRRIDLDLHGMALNAGHVGWNAQYRSGNRSLIFTGDITDPPEEGASELFYINKDYEDTVLLTLNYYNFDPSLPVPFKIMVAEEHPNSFGTNYTINPNNMKCIVKSVIDVKQKVIGLGTVKNGECRFYFSETALGDSRAIRGGKYVNIARDYLANYATNQITFNEILEKVGAKIVTEPTKKSIDLSIEALQKDTFINLLVK